MDELLQAVRHWLATDRAATLGEAVVVFLLGLLLARLVSLSLTRLLRSKLSPQQGLLLRRICSYAIVGLAVAASLRAAGLDLSVFLGAAGILTVALGFASQTSASNLISGLFLLGERAFQVGDVIRIDTTTGEVVSIDWLSVKLRTFDNLMVRLPNETALKSEIVNLTRYPIRRFDLLVGVAYKEDLRRVFAILKGVAEANPLCLDEPEPRIFFLGFGESSIDLQFSVWTTRESWVELKTFVPVEVKEAFDAAGIEIPFPHRALYAGSVTEPFPIVQVEREEGSV